MLRRKIHVKLSKKQKCGSGTTVSNDSRQKNLHECVFPDSRIRSVPRREIFVYSTKTVKFTKTDLQDNQSTRI